MPCYDSRNDPDYVRGEERKQAFRDFTHNSPVAKMLCGVLTHMHPQMIAQLPAATRAWWVEHQERDRLRVIWEREAAEKKQHNEAIDRQIKALQRKRK